MTNDNQSGTNNSGAGHSSGGTVETILNTSYDDATPLFRNKENTSTDMGNIL